MLFRSKASMSRLDEILSSLAGLARPDLDVVIATAQALARSRARGGGQSRPQVRKGKKGPSESKSEYADNPHYKAFKDAERALHVRQKELGKKLSELAPKGQDSPGLEPTVARFFEARQRWFREKAALSEPPTSSTTSATGKAPAATQAKPVSGAPVGSRA